MIVEGAVTAAGAAAAERDDVVFHVVAALPS